MKIRSLCKILNRDLNNNLTNIEKYNLFSFPIVINIIRKREHDHPLHLLNINLVVLF